MPEADIEDETVVSKANRGVSMEVFLKKRNFIYLPAPGSSLDSRDFQPSLWHVISWGMQTLTCGM